VVGAALRMSQQSIGRSVSQVSQRGESERGMGHKRELNMFIHVFYSFHLESRDQIYVSCSPLRGASLGDGSVSPSPGLPLIDARQGRISEAIVDDDRQLDRRTEGLCDDAPHHLERESPAYAVTHASALHDIHGGPSYSANHTISVRC
jgi:hypothetical protein